MEPSKLGKLAAKWAVIAVLLSSTSGCLMCCNPMYDAYPAYGGAMQRTDRFHGRVGSAIEPAGVSVVGRGEAPDFIWERNTAPGGQLPTNTNGGGLSYMHSGMYGMYALQESVRQMRGEAAAQIDGAEVSVCLGVGGMFGASGCIVFGVAPRA